MNEQKNQELASAFYEKAYHLQMTGYLDKAIIFYKRSIEFYPSAQTYTFLGWSYSLKGLLDKAIENCKIAIQLDANYGYAYNDIGAYLFRQRKLDEAIPWFEKALRATNYADYCFPNINLGKIYEMKGRWDMALDYYAHAIKENPANGDAQTAYDNLSGKYN
jgi:tetratricopeptide (TPR) repeat protein